MEVVGNMNLRKISGVYLDILAQGGISSTVQGHMEALKISLWRVQRLLDYMLRHGVTTVEAKRAMAWLGNGKRQLDVVVILDDQKLIWFRLFMAAHAIPIEYKGRSQEYLDLIVEQMLPKVKEEKASWVSDIF